MKKVLSLLSFVLLSVFLTSCNYEILDVQYKFNKVHATFDGENYQCYEIKSWTDYEGEQIQVDIKGYGKVLLSSYNSILVEDKCPYYDKSE